MPAVKGVFTDAIVPSIKANIQHHLLTSIRVPVINMTVRPNLAVPDSRQTVSVCRSNCDILFVEEFEGDCKLVCLHWRRQDLVRGSRETGLDLRENYLWATSEIYCLTVHNKLGAGNHRKLAVGLL